MDITVVIPCLNEEQYIGRLLDDLASRSYALKSVIVVDCNSVDKTISVAETYALKIPLKALLSARNTGAEASQSSYLLFLDADMQLPEDYIAEMVAKAKIEHAEFISPRFKAEGRNVIDKIVVVYINCWIAIYHMRIRKHVMGIGGAMLIKKTRHDSIGGYNPRLREFDDIDYFRRLNAYKIPHTFARNAMGISSDRRYVKQGRLRTIIQGLHDKHKHDRLLRRSIIV